MKTIFYERDNNHLLFTFTDKEVRVKGSRDNLDKFENHIMKLCRDVNIWMKKKNILITLRGKITPKKDSTQFYYILLSNSNHTKKFSLKYDETDNLQFVEYVKKRKARSIVKLLKSEITIEYDKNSRGTEKRWKIFINKIHKAGIREIEEGKYEVYSIIPKWKFERFIISDISIETLKDKFKEVIFN